mmetsp:Transcript_27111/g.76286  ORF Transcript_27111/g.76286 Transcript_27111/m.76286 type:complete len:313 (-) Transcript_27111:411-1349(-)
MVLRQHVRVDESLCCDKRVFAVVVPELQLRHAASSLIHLDGQHVIVLHSINHPLVRRSHHLTNLDPRLRCHAPLRRNRHASLVEDLDLPFRRPTLLEAVLPQRQLGDFVRRWSRLQLLAGFLHQLLKRFTLFLCGHAVGCLREDAQGTVLTAGCEISVWQCHCVPHARRVLDDRRFTTLQLIPHYNVAIFGGRHDPTRGRSCQRHNGQHHRWMLDLLHECQRRHARRVLYASQFDRPVIRACHERGGILLHHHAGNVTNGTVVIVGDSMLAGDLSRRGVHGPQSNLMIGNAVVLRDACRSGCNSNFGAVAVR